MPDNSTWDDLIYEIYVRQVIEKGLLESNSGKVKEVSEIRKKIWFTMMKVFRTETAENHLDAIFSFISLDSPEYAKQMIDRMTRRSIQIAEFPLSGRKVPEYEMDQIRGVFEGFYRVIYHVKPDQIDILAIIHTHHP
jgi:toxin ParE1/3/4